MAATDPAPSTRDRLVDTTAELMWRQGYAATGLKQVVDTSGVPTGSLYHHFPGGKEELAAAALRAGAAHYEAVVGAALAADADVVVAVRASFRSAGRTLEASGWADACPIATVALEIASTNEALRVVAAEIFTRWIDILTALFEGAGVDAAVARRLAYLYLTVLEGGFVLARTTRSVEPLESAGDVVADQLAAALEPAP